jgi:hypothetical protein
MHAHDAGPVEAVEVAITDHLRRHPLAADSAEGVARWWLGPAHAGVTVAQVERALNLLVARQKLRRLRLMDGTILYTQAPPTRQ